MRRAEIALQVEKGSVKFRKVLMLRFLLTGGFSSHYLITLDVHDMNAHVMDLPLKWFVQG